MKSFMEDVGIKVSEHRRIFISEQNIHRFNHGIKWQSHNSDKPDDISTMEVISNELEFEKTDISQYETQTLSRLVTVLSERISDSFARSMYATLNDSCDQAGQVVDAKGKTLAESFVEILEKIEFTVDREGNPSLPQLHVAPGQAERIRDDPDLNSEAVQRRIAELTERKIQEALQREKTRLEKFRKIDNDIATSTALHWLRPI